CSLLCANLGGDTDTIGAMACAICGAYQGYTALDSSWVELINEANDVNLMEYVDALAKQRGGVM
ncbi:ADP-ribosylglycohydrolase family protein, partial [Acinetobacter baumannii]